MTFIEIAGQRYPATISGKLRDTDWDNRKSKAITLEMTHAEAMAMFTNGLAWSIVYQAADYIDEAGNTVTPEPVIYDNSEYDVAGPVTDNRDGTVTVKMGVLTAEEALAELREVLDV